MSNNPLPSSFDGNTEFYEENRWQKFSRRLKEEPFVPIGCLATCYALYRATLSMRKGDHDTTNRMFRWRIYGQGFTLVAIVAGSIYYKTERDQRKIFTDELAKKKALEKRDAWIRELEARDREDQDYKANRKAMIAAAEEAAQQKKRAGEARSIIENSEGRGLGIIEAAKDAASSRKSS